MPAFTLDVSTLDSGATLGEEAPFSPYLAPSETLLAGDLLAPSEGAVYPSSVTYPGEHVYNDELHMVFRNRDSGFWKEPLDWERADISPAHLYYEEFVRPSSICRAVTSERRVRGCLFSPLTPRQERSPGTRVTAP